MLVLTRKISEKIDIGKNIQLTVVDVDKNTVRIGIEAPDDVEIMRTEIKKSKWIKEKVPPIVTKKRKAG